MATEIFFWMDQGVFGNTGVKSAVTGKSTVGSKGLICDQEVHLSIMHFISNLYSWSSKAHLSVMQQSYIT